MLLDVRTPGEYQAGHIVEAQNIPLQAIQAGPATGLPGDKTQTIVTICGVGKRSHAAALLLRAQGYTDVKSVNGGMQQWVGEGRPLKIR